MKKFFKVICTFMMYGLLSVLICGAMVIAGGFLLSIGYLISSYVFGLTGDAHIISTIALFLALVGGAVGIWVEYFQ